jgi:hypothetical protein
MSLKEQTIKFWKQKNISYANSKFLNDLKKRLYAAIQFTPHIQESHFHELAAQRIETSLYCLNTASALTSVMFSNCACAINILSNGSR